MFDIIQIFHYLIGILTSISQYPDQTRTPRYDYVGQPSVHAAFDPEPKDRSERKSSYSNASSLKTKKNPENVVNPNPSELEKSGLAHVCRTRVCGSTPSQHTHRASPGK